MNTCNDHLAPGFAFCWRQFGRMLGSCWHPGLTVGCLTICLCCQGTTQTTRVQLNMLLIIIIKNGYSQVRKRKRSFKNLYWPVKMVYFSFVSVWKREGEEIDLSNSWVRRCPQTPGLDPAAARSPGTHPDLLWTRREPGYLSHPLVPPGCTLAGSWSQKPG